ncbi:NADH-ubiquinone oxidoreductase 105 kDa subunit [Cordyceps militaris CM01]|uniref:NADH-ubiquinone oxidoreductase 105 kDa subunit n=1 Tax=Cordyceps militaris (strain CM01) TaxID=983644 RepID=G3JAF7_CORMM|nr:NADH-ubiquinone oxidoreductase 105 kDa subunit [Cordyceps militaris CM01]EGX95125.1 NADH-ubiquinone oxidoreductase 105 kDa subunit [Cordyceps militaris CM01]
MSGKYAFTKSLKELRFLFCQTSEVSAPVRPHNALASDESANAGIASNFLVRAYPTMKKNNPNVPIMMREAAGTVPKVFARYEFGVEKAQSLEGLSDKQIEDTITGLVKQ